MTGSDLPHDDFVELLSAVPDISSHTVQHLLTVATLHRDDRYNRLTTDVEDVTGRPAQSVEQYVAAHRELFSKPAAAG